MTPSIIQRPADADRLRAALADAATVAVDCEAAGFHRYSDRLCLVQVSVADEDFVIDPLAFDPSELLGPPFRDPAVRILMHGSDFDLRLLDRDLGLRIRGLFDTQVAASLLGEPVLGLSPLLERHLGIKLSKKYQRADWARRPLPDDMVEYAASDTQHLGRLAAILEAELKRTGRADWAAEEFRLLESVHWEEVDRDDPVTRVRGAHKMALRDVAALREALEWRDEMARTRDRAPFRIAGDDALVAAATERPRTQQGLLRIGGISRSVAKSAGHELLERLRAIEELPERALRGYPTDRTRGPGRPTPEVEALAALLKSVRNRRAKELGLARGTLMSNSTLMEIARLAPSSRRELAEVPGVKTWQMDAVGEELLDVLGGTREAAKREARRR